MAMEVLVWLGLDVSHDPLGSENQDSFRSVESIANRIVSS
jgi:hypothetical protein